MCATYSRRAFVLLFASANGGEHIFGAGAQFNCVHGSGSITAHDFPGEVDRVARWWPAGVAGAQTYDGDDCLDYLLARKCGGHRSDKRVYECKQAEWRTMLLCRLTAVYVCVDADPQRKTNSSILYAFSITKMHNSIERTARSRRKWTALANYLHTVADEAKAERIDYIGWM